MPITDRQVLPMFSSFYYGLTPPAIASAPRIGAPMFQLKFRNGYVTGIVCSAKLDRFLSYGVHLGYFRQGAWYRLPARASLELGRLTAQLEPMRLTRAALRRSA